jgi:1L-myo-inositol 1-phosphate cytidylyltransferase / CDP-L-myo-inositol myo-inositolphosphotransferase
MAYIAVVTALQPRADLPAHPRASLEVGGMMLLERNIRLLRQAGAQTIYVLTDDQFAVLAPLVSELGKAKDIKLIGNALDLTNSLVDDDSIMVLDEGVLLDERLIAAVAADDQPHCIAVFPSLAPEHERAVRIDPEYSFASILKAPGKAVRDVCRGLGDWDFVHTLLRAVAAQPDAQMLAVSSLDVYVEDRRRTLPILWQPMKSAADETIATSLLIDATQAHVLDWPARFLHPPVENIGLRFLLAKAANPVWPILSQVAVGALSMGCFAAGWLWAGLLLILAYGPLEGLSLRLARLQINRQSMDRLLPIIGAVCEAGGYATLAWHFSYIENKTNAWSIFFIIILCRVTAKSLHSFYHGFTAKHLDDTGATERRMRLFAARRNTAFWALLPFAAFDSWWLGYQFIGLYTAATFFWAQLRFFIRLKEYGVAASPVVAANFRRVGYGILRRGKSGTS